jgi:hypothetical protein
MVRVPKALNTSETNKKGKEKNWLAGVLVSSLDKYRNKFSEFI